MSAYASTTVSVEASQGSIRKLLASYGCERFGFGEYRLDNTTFAEVGFTKGDASVRMRVPLKPIDETAVRRKVQRARTKDADTLRFEANEQEAKRIWRVLHWNLKARLEAVQEGVETFEEAFLAHLLVPGRPDTTVYEALRADGGMRLLGRGDD